MIVLLLVAAAQAQPGRTTATGTVGVVAEDLGLTARGSVDYGLTRRLSVSGEAGLLAHSPVSAPGWAVSDLSAEVGLAPVLEIVDSRWWRLSAVAMPALTVAPGPGRPPGYAVGEAGIVLRTGVRVHWLAFWGASLCGRVDHVRSLDGTGGWTEVALGAAVRM